MSRPVDQAKNAEAFLADTVHEQRLDKLLWAARMRRDAAARQVPEWEELRTLASEIKEHTLSNLSDYLTQFEAKATANGVIVHWAKDRCPEWCLPLLLTASASRSECLTRLNTRPVLSPVNASTPPSQAVPHDSGPVWFATPLPYDFFIHYTSPV